MQLSVVICAYDMQREVPRTVRAFLPGLQRGAEDIAYEIIVVDNGSPAPLELETGRLAPNCEVRLERIEADDAAPSPAACMNRAVRDLARGAHVMVCIDGARLPSAGLVARSAAAVVRWPEAFVYVTSRHLGPKRQSQSVKEGYDQAAEDALLDTLRWDADLDNLYAGSVWASAVRGGRFFDVNESNAFTLHRDTIARRGLYDEGFARPGGGLCNLELFARHVGHEQAMNICLYGEATFHQFHGGAATADDSYFQAALEEHRAVTGRDYARPDFAALIDVAAGDPRQDALREYFG